MLGALLTNFLTQAKACFTFSRAPRVCLALFLLSVGSPMKTFQSPLSRVLRRLALRLMAPLLLLLTLAGCSQDDSKKNTPPPAPVRVEAVACADVPRLLHAVGNVRASSAVGVKPRVTGEIQQVHFTEGQDVREGDPLITIDPRPYQAAVEGARAELDRVLGGA